MEAATNSINNTFANPAITAQVGAAAMPTTDSGQSVDNRMIAENIAQPVNRSSELDLGVSGTLKKGVGWLSRLSSTALKAVGFVSGSVAVVTYFLLNFKLGAMFFGIPAVASFLLAHFLGKTGREMTHVQGNSDAMDILQKARTDATYLESKANLSKVLAVMESVKDMSNGNPKKQKAFDVLVALKHKVDAKVDKLNSMDEGTEKLAELRDYQKFNSLYDEIAHDLSQANPVEQPDQPLHRDDDLLTDLN